MFPARTSTKPPRHSRMQTCYRATYDTLLVITDITGNSRRVSVTFLPFWYRSRPRHGKTKRTIPRTNAERNPRDATDYGSPGPITGKPTLHSSHKSVHDKLQANSTQQLAVYASVSNQTEQMPIGRGLSHLTVVVCRVLRPKRRPCPRVPVATQNQGWTTDTARG